MVMVDRASSFLHSNLLLGLGSNVPSPPPKSWPMIGITLLIHSFSYTSCYYYGTADYIARIFLPSSETRQLEGTVRA